MLSGVRNGKLAILRRHRGSGAMSLLKQRGFFFRTSTPSRSGSDLTPEAPTSPIEPPSVDGDAVITTSLQGLQCTDQRKVLDLVDDLRRTGLEGIIGLPQLVVCGDQSSGKSSVLEAITEIPFPRKENLCTRFATEIILRRSKLATSTITIVPDKLRPERERKKLKSFARTINDFGQLPEVIEQATLEMGLTGAAETKAFARDVLSVEITGPDRPQLTLVDLPGLIHSANKAQTETDKDLILNLVQEYMSNSRTIILAVVSAKNDFANQVILDHCRKIDEQGRRTLGIITKPDFLRAGTDNELNWIELAQNKNVYLERGWHILKNREDHQANTSSLERNADEDAFFNKGRYAELPRDCVGVAPLRERLSTILLSHLIMELPALETEMKTKLALTKQALERLGERRTTSQEQRMVLIKISTRISDIIKSAVNGQYDAPFFGSIDTNKAVDSMENNRRFRAVIQHLNLKFANDMRLRGHKYAIGAGPGDDPNDVSDAEKAQNEFDSLCKMPENKFSTKPKKLTRAEGIDWVKKSLERARGFELPGTFQPMLISQLFWEQSQPWEKIAAEHVSTISCVCKNFVTAVIENVAPTEFHERLSGLNVNKALTLSLSNAKKELRKIIEDKTRHPSTYNHYFTSNIQKIRQQKLQTIGKAASSAALQSIQTTGSKTKQVINPELLALAMDKAVEPDMDVFSSSEALDTQRAYYKDEMKYFINAVTKTVIERHLVGPLPDIILSPLIVTQMSDKEVRSVAAEPSAVSQQRAHLESRKAMLEKGLETFREAMGGLRR
ncbi:hypothetical protein NX059_008448 [Plenodomus lindquistii]|nr:hypothetical protein NX059_008448 [Plenodomus lindquistii]